MIGILGEFEIRRNNMELLMKYDFVQSNNVNLRMQSYMITNFANKYRRLDLPEGHIQLLESKNESPDRLASAFRDE